MRLVAFCEALADFTIASDLVDRVLREHGPSWVADLMADAPEGVRTWRADGDGHAFFDIHEYRDRARRLSVRLPHGRFDGARTPGAFMALTICMITRRLSQAGPPIDGLVLIWDMDDQPAARANALEQARVEASSWASFAIVIGRPNAKREAWVLAGFEPVDDEERRVLQDLRQELGFAPNEQSARLDATDDHAKRSAKRVLAALTRGDRDRERACWLDTSLAILERRGDHNGLKSFLTEINDRLVPLCLKRRAD